MNPTVKKTLRFFLFLGIGVAIMYWLYTSMDAAFQEDCARNNIPPEDCNLLQKLADDFSSVNYFWVFMVLLAFVVSNVSRAIRWQMMLRSTGHATSFKNAFISILTGYFANSVIPRSGEFARAGLLAKTEDIPLEKVIGTIAVDRSLDLLSLGIVVLIGFSLEYDLLYNFLAENMGDPTEKLKSPLFIGAAIIGVLGFLGAIIFRKSLSQFKIYRWFEDKVKGFWQGIVSIRKVKNPLAFLFHSIMIWLMYFSMMYLGFFCFPPTAHLGAGTALIAFVFGAFGILIPSPGGLGAYQVLVTTCLNQFYGIEYSDAFSFSNINFFPTYIMNIVAGFIAMLLIPGLKKTEQPHSSDG